jgi:signal transduction histidine kinase
LECGKYIKQEEKTLFLDKMIKARIGIRVLAEHHLALHESMHGWIGIVHTEFKPSDLVKNVSQYVEELCDLNYGSFPTFEMIGQVDTTVPYIPVHVEYILMEILKNAARATVEHSDNISRNNHPPIQICIAEGEDITMRVRDQGGGSPPSCTFII